MLDDVRSDISALCEDFVAQVLTVDDYDAGLVPVERITEDAETSFEYLLDLLCGRSPAYNPAPFVGTDRARRGIPLRSLMTAIRLDAAIVWDAVRGRARPAQFPVIIDHVADVLAAVEEYAREVQQAYLEEVAVIRRQADDERDALFARLLLGESSTLLHDAIAAALGVEADRHFVVHALPIHRSDPLRLYQRELSESGRPCYWFTYRQQAHLVVPMPVGVSTPLPQRLRRLGCASSPVCRGVAELRDAIEVAGALGAGITDSEPGPVTLRSGWAPALLRASPVIARALLHDTLGPLAVAPDQAAAQRLSAPPTSEGRAGRGRAGTEAGDPDPRERARLLDTLRAYLDSGSVSDTAGRLFCHRNTVVNRLRRVRTLTGLDPGIPSDAALLLVALTVGEPDVV